MTVIERRESTDGVVSDIAGIDRYHRAFLWTAAALSIVVLWIRPMFSSFWTDEFGTWWVISGSARDVVTRSDAVQGQSPAYYLIAWAMKQIVGRSEFWLRFPSLVFGLASLFLVYRIAVRLLDAEAARIAVVVLVLWPTAAFSASNARPYALGMLLVLAATLALLRWLDTARASSAIVYALLAGAVPYVHPLFALLWVPHLLYAWFRVREGSTNVKPLAFVSAGLGAMAIAAPVALEVLALWRRQSDWNIPGSTTAPNTVSVDWLSSILLPSAFACTAVLGALFLTRRVHLDIEIFSLPRSTLVLLVGWLLIPPFVLGFLSEVTSLHLLVARYLLVTAPAAALLVAFGVRALGPPLARRLVVLLLVVLSVFALASPYISGDWRGAASLARSTTDRSSVVFIQYGFQESMQLDWFHDPERRTLFTSPASFYPIPGDVVPLPVDLDGSTIGFARRQVDANLAHADKVVVIAETDSAYRSWFEEHLRDLGWTETHVGDVNLYSVDGYTRSAASTTAPVSATP